MIETNMVVKENLQISNETYETLRVVKEIMSDQDEYVKSIVASFSSQLESMDHQLDSKELQIAELTKAVAVLAGPKSNAAEEIDAALQALYQGDTEKAERIFQARVEAGEAESLKTAESYRHLGSWHFFMTLRRRLMHTSDRPKSIRTMLMAGTAWVSYSIESVIWTGLSPPIENC